MKKHLELLRILVAFVAIGKTASLSLQVPLQTQQGGLGSQGPGSGFPAGPSGSFGEGVGAGSRGLFPGSVDQSQNAGTPTGFGESLGTGGGAGSPGGFPGGGGVLGSISGRGGIAGMLGGLTSPSGSAGSLRRGSTGPFGTSSSGGYLGTSAGGSAGDSLGPGGFGIHGAPGPGGSISGGPSVGIPGSSGSSGLLGGVVRALSGGITSSGTPVGPFGSAGIENPEGSGPSSFSSGRPSGQATPFGGNAGSRGSQGSGGVPGLPIGDLGSPAVTSTTLGNGLSTSGGPARSFPVTGGYESTAASGPRIFDSGTAGSSPFGQPASSTDTSFGGGPGTGITRQPRPESSLTLPNGGGFGAGSSIPQPGGSHSNSDSSGVGAEIGGSGTGAPVLTGPGGQLGRPRLPGRGSSRGGSTSLGGQRRKPGPAEAAAIGLSVAAGLLAAGALGAGIASVVGRQQQERLAKPSGGCFGRRPKPCIGRCGRERRSTAESKVPAHVLDSIPMNFERL